MPWLYMPTLEHGNQIPLPDSELRHLIYTHRRRVGDQFVLFNGKGIVATAEINQIKRKPLQMVYRELSREKLSPSDTNIHLATALPKGDRQGVLLDAAAQLGITNFIPLQCERSVSRIRTSSYERWEKILIEACKQSHRPWLPDLQVTTAPLEYLEECRMSDGLVLLADSGGRSLNHLKANAPSSGDVWLFVGPEGGFTAAEYSGLVSNGAIPVSLGRSTLRVETAALAFLAIVRNLFDL